jgi:hypothetical protein
MRGSSKFWQSTNNFHRLDGELEELPGKPSGESAGDITGPLISAKA